MDERLPLPIPRLWCCRIGTILEYSVMPVTVTRVSGNRGNLLDVLHWTPDNDVTTTSGTFADRAGSHFGWIWQLYQPPVVHLDRKIVITGVFLWWKYRLNPSYAYAGCDTTPIPTEALEPTLKLWVRFQLHLIDERAGQNLFAPWSPRNFISGFRTGQLVNGMAHWNRSVSKASPSMWMRPTLKVYVTLEGDCNGSLLLTNPLMVSPWRNYRRTSNAKFSWQIVANRADTMDEMENVVSKHVGLRLPVGTRTTLTVLLRKIKPRLKT